MSELVLKTIEECTLKLVAHTMIPHVEQIPGPGVFNSALFGDEATLEGFPATYFTDCDFMPCSAARVSFGNEDKTGDDPEKDIKLMNYLAEHQHMTPFEYQHATFLIECPLFIRSQIMRHRAFSYNEISRRYTSDDMGFWIPDKWRGQSKSNRQASSDEIIDGDLVNVGIYPDAEVNYRDMLDVSLRLYENLVEAGVAREQARAILPQALLTKFYMGGNLRSWAHFIELRRDEHAQAEVRVIADRIGSVLRDLWPNSSRSLGL